MSFNDELGRVYVLRDFQKCCTNSLKAQWTKLSQYFGRAANVTVG